MSTENKELKVLSVFKGIGVATDALKQMGIDIICEIDEAANKTYYSDNEKTNHKNNINDINDLLLKIEKGKVIDILIQTPPCQSFSLGGLRKGLDSDNENLFLTSIMLQKKINANVVIYENVKGLISHDKGEFTYQKEDGTTFTTRSKKSKRTLDKTKITLIESVDLSYKSLINKDYKKTIGHTLHTIEKLLLEDDRYNYYWKVVNNTEQGFPKKRGHFLMFCIKKELDYGTFKFPKI